MVSRNHEVRGVRREVRERCRSLGLAILLLIIALITVPWMLFVKPYILLQELKKHPHHEEPEKDSIPLQVQGAEEQRLIQADQPTAAYQKHPDDWRGE